MDNFENLVFIQGTNSLRRSRVFLCLLGLILVPCHNSTPYKGVQDREYMAKRSKSLIIGLNSNLAFSTGHMTTLMQYQDIVNTDKGKIGH